MSARTHKGIAHLSSTAERVFSPLPAASPDVTIIGGGPIGLIQGIALARAGIAVALIDRETAEAHRQKPFDGRSYAIAYGSKRILDGLGVWDRIAGAAEPILEIRVADNNAPLFLHYDHKEVGDAPFGWIVDSNLLQGALLEAARGLPSLTIIAPAAAIAVERGADTATVTLGDGRVLDSRLVIAADGRRSTLRQDAGIKVFERRYDQNAITTAVTHSLPHHGVAVEHFLPAGPFAILPMTGDAEGRHRSSIVWTERPAVAETAMGMGEEDFAAELRARFGTFLGDVTPIGPRWCHPLSVIYARRLTDRRLALIGDAAHAIHPIAGQGLNLGIRGVAKLAGLIIERSRLGLDPGSSDLLASYQRQHFFDRLTLTAVTDGLNRLFSNDIAPVKLIRDAGLALVGTPPMAPVRKMLMRHAMGTPISG